MAWNADEGDVEVLDQPRRMPLRLLLLILVAVAAGAGVQASPGALRAQGGSQLLVQFRAGVSSAAAASLVRGAGAAERRTIPGIGVHVLAVPSTGLARALGTLKASGRVAFAEQDGIVTPQEVLPNDPYFLNSGAWNISGGAWGWYQTRTTQAWDVTRGDPSVIVAILDTGLKTTGISDFDGQVVSGWNVLSNSADTSSQAGNHGTYVAGVVGLAMANGVGNSGFCPRCTVMPVQVGTDSGATWSDLASGIAWAADHGARIENLSWAGTSGSSTLTSAVSYARSKGVVV
ncbi:MAG: thermitase, partial [Gaiellaceae bacterium]|nr:thermitase [Gaiellaceae bacterium]